MVKLRTTNYPKRKPVEPHPNPLFRQIFDIIEHRKLSLTSIEAAGNFGHGVISRLRNCRTTLNLDNMLKLVDLLGYRLILVRKEPVLPVANHGNAVNMNGHEFTGVEDYAKCQRRG